MDAFALQQRLAQKAADEPGSTGDEDSLIFKISHKRNVRSYDLLSL